MTSFVLNDLDNGSSESKIVHINGKHAHFLSKSMNDLKKSGELCDVAILVNDKKIYAHRLVLSVCSNYFRKLFISKIPDQRQSEIPVDNEDENAVDILIDFCYTGRIIIEEENVRSLLSASCLLQLEEIQDICCQFLKRQMDPTNCLSIRIFAEAIEYGDLLRIADKYIAHNFQEVAENGDFLLITLDQLVDIISNDALNVRTEEQTYEAVLKWIQHSFRRETYITTTSSFFIYFTLVLQHVRLCLCDPEFLVTTVGSDPLIKSNVQCRDLLDEAKNYLLLPQKRDMMQSPRTKPRKPVKFDDKREVDLYSPPSNIDENGVVDPSSGDVTPVSVGGDEAHDNLEANDNMIQSEGEIRECETNESPISTEHGNINCTTAALYGPAHMQLPTITEALQITTHIISNAETSHTNVEPEERTEESIELNQRKRPISVSPLEKNTKRQKESVGLKGKNKKPKEMCVWWSNRKKKRQNSKGLIKLKQSTVSPKPKSLSGLKASTVPLKPKSLDNAIIWSGLTEMQKKLVVQSLRSENHIHTCCHCDEKFLQKEQGQRHIMKHLNFIKFRCTACSAGSFFRVDMLIHLKTKVCPKMAKDGPVMSDEECDQKTLSADEKNPGVAIFWQGKIISRDSPEGQYPTSNPNVYNS